jgi:site-specific DNA-cytosine methylase
VGVQNLTPAQYTAAAITFTYPDEFELVGSRQSAQTQLGNSVPPLLAEKVVRALHGEA